MTEAEAKLAKPSQQMIAFHMWNSLSMRARPHTEGPCRCMMGNKLRKEKKEAYSCTLLSCSHKLDLLLLFLTKCEIIKEELTVGNVTSSVFIVIRGGTCRVTQTYVSDEHNVSSPLWFLTLTASAARSPTTVPVSKGSARRGEVKQSAPAAHQDE